MSYYFDTQYYLNAKVAQLRHKVEYAPDGQVFTPESLTAYMATLGLTPQSHYELYGHDEGLKPNSYFDEAFYLQGKVDQLHSIGENDAEGKPYTTQSLHALLDTLGLTAAEHYERYGAYETFADGSHIDPSRDFDADTYFQNKLTQLITIEPKQGWAMPELLTTMQASGMSPVTHYLQYGMGEEQAFFFSLLRHWDEVSAFTSKWEFMKSVYFDESAYVRNKTDALNAEHAEGRAWTTDDTLHAIQDAGLTPWEDFSRYGAFERSADGGYGINPSKYFDLDTYYADLIDYYAEESGTVYSKEAILQQMQDANLDPITHYSVLGFRYFITPRLEDLGKKSYSVIDQFTFTGDGWIHQGDIPLSGDYKIDALLGYWTGSLNAAPVKHENTLYYAFPKTPFFGDGTPLSYPEDFKEFGVAAKENVHTAAKYISKITGIHLEYTETVSEAAVLFYEGALNGDFAWTSGGYFTKELSRPFQIIFELGFSTDYSFLLHEWGHALGLKHSFEDEGGIFPTVLPPGEDDKHYTTMAPADVFLVYPEVDTGDSKDWYVNYYSPYDIMALNYIYGTDGLGGEEGLVYAPRVAATGVTTATEFADAQGV
jgi:hypothetical protein